MKKIFIVIFILIIVAVLVLIFFRAEDTEKHGPSETIEYAADGEVIRVLDKEKNVIFEYSIDEFRGWVKEHWHDIFEEPPAFGELRDVDPENFFRFDNTASLSPDRNFLAFSVHDYAALTSISFVGIIDFKTAEVKLISEASVGNLQNLIWSPRGSHLAYILDTGRAYGDFLSIDNATELKKEVMLSGDDILDSLENSDPVEFMPRFRNLKWTEDGQKLKFTSNNIKERGMLNWSINVEGTDLARRLELHFFWAPGCAFCDRQKVFLERIGEEYPVLEIYQYSTVPRENRDILEGFMEYYPGSEEYFGSVPITFIEDEFFVGFSEDKTGRDIERLIERQKESDGKDRKTTYILPVFGEIDPDDMPLLGWAVVISLVDGFNICAIGSLVLILVLVLALDSRKLTFVFGGLFIIITALAYGFLIFLWSRLFSLFASYMLPMSIIIGSAALFGAIYFLRQALRLRKHGPACNMKDNGLVSAVSQKLERAFKEKKSILTILGVIALFAVIITIIEFPCSAVFPVVFTAMLAQAELTFLDKLFYILVYVFFYMFIAIAIFLSAVFTKKIWIASGKFMAWVSIIGSLILFALAYHYFSLIPDYLAT